MPDWLNPEYLVSSAAGGGAVAAIMRVHLHYLTKELSRHAREIEKLYSIVYGRRSTDGRIENE